MGFAATNPLKSSSFKQETVAPETEGEGTPREEFWKRHPGFVWSNRQAGDGVRIRAALLRPIFPVLLEIAVEFGLERLEQEWAVLRGDEETDTDRVERFVAQILGNIRRGYEQACA
jgi:hypothetical protein